MKLPPEASLADTPRRPRQGGTLAPTPRRPVSGSLDQACLNQGQTLWSPLPSPLNLAPDPNGAPLPETIDGFAWETLRSFLDGVSPIDLTRLAFYDRNHAREFLLHYGYDLDRPVEAEDGWSVFREALDYLERILCPAPIPGDTALSMPPELGRIEEIADLLVLASSEGPLQPWACALLRVMHTISHANHAVRSPFYREIQQQILDRYREHLVETPDKQLFLGRGAAAVPLEGVFFREEKNRDSMILKLLHKPANVAQDVFDRIGVKLVTPTRVEALLAVRYIRMNNLAMFSNIAPGRARNTLIDIEMFREVLASLPSDDDESVETRVSRERERFLATPTPEIPWPTQGSGNPHSSRAFHSIQFTCRQLIRIANPVFLATKKLREDLSEVWPQAEVDRRLAAIELHGGEETLRFFFPYEVQILDKENHELSESGESSHANYRLRQLRVARRRVLGGLLQG